MKSTKKQDEIKKQDEVPSKWQNDPSSPVV